jgi:hypothetical protein
VQTCAHKPSEARCTACASIRPVNNCHARTPSATACAYILSILTVSFVTWPLALAMAPSNHGPPITFGQVCIHLAGGPSAQSQMAVRVLEKRVQSKLAVRVQTQHVQYAWWITCTPQALKHRAQAPPASVCCSCPEDCAFFCTMLLP